MNVTGINSISQKRNQQSFGMEIKYEGDGKEILIKAVKDVFQIKPGQTPLEVEQIAQRAKIFSDNVKRIVESPWRLIIGHDLCDSIIFSAKKAGGGYKLNQFQFSNKENEFMERLERFLAETLNYDKEMPQPHVKTVLDAIG